MTAAEPVIGRPVSGTGRRIVDGNKKALATRRGSLRLQWFGRF
jgi:hypothetical protein